MENFWDRRSRSGHAGRSSCRRTAARSAGATSSSARSRPTKPTDSQRARRRVVRARLQRQGLHRLGRPARQLRDRGRRHPLQAEEGRHDLHGRRSTPTSSCGWSSSCRRPATTAWRSATPGKGDTAYVGMSELQVLDNTAPEYAKLDPRQFHGSAYGMVAAQRGFLRPVGEWNFQQVTVRGSTITVELNGTTILDADLSTVTEFLDNKAHPGKDRKAGHFGFAGHNDPVEYQEGSNQGALGWRLEAGGWRLEAGGWRLELDWSRSTDADWERRRSCLPREHASRSQQAHRVPAGRCAGHRYLSGNSELPGFGTMGPTESVASRGRVSRLQYC